LIERAGRERSRDAFPEKYAFIASSMRVSAMPNDDLAQLRALETAVESAFANKDVAAVMAAYAPVNWLIVQEHASLPIDRRTFTPILHISMK
jgi:hypothetical protein